MYTVGLRQSVLASSAWLQEKWEAFDIAFKKLAAWQIVRAEIWIGQTWNMAFSLNALTKRYGRSCLRWSSRLPILQKLGQWGGQQAS